MENLLQQIKNNQINYSKWDKKNSSESIENKVTHIDLNLSQTSPIQEQITELTQIIEQYPDLQFLKLDFQKRQFKGEILNRITKMLNGCTQLKTLIFNLEWNSMNLENCQLFCDGIPNLQNLTHLILNLKWNLLRKAGIDILSQQLRKFSQLKQLNLDVSICQIGKNGLNNFNQEILNCPQLESLVLNFGSSDLENQGVLDLLSECQQLQYLKIIQLELGKNNIDDDGLIGIMVSICKFKSLEKMILNLEQNMIGIGLDALSELNDQFFSLSTFNLNLRENSICNSSIEGLFNYLSKCQIKDLLINLDKHNQRKQTSQMFKQLPLNHCLEQFSLSSLDNNWQYKDILQLLQQFKQCSMLTKLQLKLEDVTEENEIFKILTKFMKEIPNLNTLNIHIKCDRIPRYHIGSAIKNLKEAKKLYNLIFQIPGMHFDKIEWQSILKFDRLVTIPNYKTYSEINF